MSGKYPRRLSSDEFSAIAATARKQITPEIRRLLDLATLTESALSADELAALDDYVAAEVAFVRSFWDARIESDRSGTAGLYRLRTYCHDGRYFLPGDISNLASPVSTEAVDLPEDS